MKDFEKDLKLQNTKGFFLNESISWATLTCFPSAELYWKEQLHNRNKNSPESMFLSNELFPIVTWIKIVI